MNCKGITELDPILVANIAFCVGSYDTINRAIKLLECRLEDIEDKICDMEDEKSTAFIEDYDSAIAIRNRYKALISDLNKTIS